MAAEQPKFGALANVLARDLKDIEDLPNYIAPVPGVYKLLIEGCKQKTLNEKTVIAVDYIVLECKELPKDTDDDDKKEAAAYQYGKDKMSEIFYFNDPERVETTLSVLKKKYSPLGQTLNTTNLLEILDKMAGMTVEAQCGRRMDDNDKSKFYPYTRNIVAAV